MWGFYQALGKNASVLLTHTYKFKHLLAQRQRTRIQHLYTHQASQYPHPPTHASMSNFVVVCWLGIFLSSSPMKAHCSSTIPMPSNQWVEFFFLGMIFRVCFKNLSQPKDTIFLGPLPLIKPWSPSVARRATTTSPSTWAPWCLPRPVAPSTKKQDGNGRDQSRSNIRINHLYQTTDCPVINVLYTIYIPFYKKKYPIKCWNHDDIMLNLINVETRNMTLIEPLEVAMLHLWLLPWGLPPASATASKVDKQPCSWGQPKRHHVNGTLLLDIHIFQRSNVEKCWKMWKHVDKCIYLDWYTYS